MNVCYLSRNRKNDPEGGSEAGVSATTTTGSEGIGLRRRPTSISFLGGRASSWVPEGENDSSIPMGEADARAKGAEPPPQLD